MVTLVVLKLHSSRLNVKFSIKKLKICLASPWTVQVLKDETGVTVNNTEWHERAHCPYNFPLICAVCTCDKMIHQIGSHNDKHHRSSLWLLMEQFCSHPVNMTRSAFYCDRRMRITERRDLFIPKKLNIWWSGYQGVDKRLQHNTQTHHQKSMKKDQKYDTNV